MFPKEFGCRNPDIRSVHLVVAVRMGLLLFRECIPVNRLLSRFVRSDKSDSFVYAYPDVFFSTSTFAL